MNTPIANIPEIAASQNNKYLTHNEALRHIEALAIAAVEGILDTPPSSPTVGQTWIVGASPTSSWVGQANKIAQKTDTGWKFYSVFVGLTVVNKSIQGFSYFDGSAWIAVSDGGTSTAIVVSNGLVDTSNVNKLTFPSGATVTNEGSGEVSIVVTPQEVQLTLISGLTSINAVDTITFTGATLTDQGNGDVQVEITPSSGGSPLTVVSGVTTVSNVDNLTFTGATVTDQGNGDVTVAITPSSSSSLVVSNGVTDNLNIDKITFTGATVTNQGSGDVTVAVTSSGGLPLAVIGGTANVTNVDKITFSGATVTNQGSGDVLVVVPPTSALTVANSATSVTNVDTITFSGATLTDQGNGDALVALTASSPLTVVAGATTVPSVDKITFTGATLTDQGNGDVSVNLNSSFQVSNSSATISNVDSINFPTATLTDLNNGDVRVELVAFKVRDPSILPANAIPVSGIVNFVGATVTSASSGGATVTITNTFIPAFASTRTESLPYTISATDSNLELELTSLTGTLSLPDDGTTFNIGWQCQVILTQPSNILIQKETQGGIGILYSGGVGFNRLKAPGSIALIYRGNNKWKVVGFMEEL